jgi:hypothetical protein
MARLHVFAREMAAQARPLISKRRIICFFVILSGNIIADLPRHIFNIRIHDLSKFRHKAKIMYDVPFSSFASIVAFPLRGALSSTSLNCCFVR